MSKTKDKKQKRLDRQARPIAITGAFSGLFGKLMMRHEVVHPAPVKFPFPPAPPPLGDIEPSPAPPIVDPSV